MCDVSWEVQNAELSTPNWSGGTKVPTFAYVVKDKAGKTHSGTLETESRNNLIEQLWKQEFVIISIDERSQGKSQILKLGQPGVKAYQLVVFSRQLATIVDSG